MTTPYLLGDLRRDEGLRQSAYPDPIHGWAVPSIGYGHTGPEVRQGLTWTQSQCDDALARDVATACHGLDKALPWWRRLDDVRQDVLANAAFNLGVQKLLTFRHTLAAIEAGDYEAAADGLLTSLWARQVGERARRLAEQMRTGVRQP